MGQLSWPWPLTSGPIIGDGREITAEEYAAKVAHTFGSGVLPTGNMLEVTSSGANTIDVDTGAAIVQGRFYVNDASVALTPASAGAGTTRKDSVVLECDWDGSGTTAQYTVRVITKEGTAGAYPAMTQNHNVRWQDELYRYIIDDAGVITAITDVRAFCQFNTHVVTAMLMDGVLSADAAGRAKVAAGFFGADAASRAKFVANFFDAATVQAKFGTDSFTNATLLRLIKDGAFQADAATRALFADNFVSLPKLVQLAGLTVLGRSVGVGNVEALAATANNQVLRVRSGVLGFGEIGANSIEDSANLQPRHVNVDTVDGLHASDLISGGIIVGAIVMWSGTLGGSDGHRPVVGGAPNEDWHLCNGDTVGSVTTPDLRDKFVVGAGSSYVKGATGGATTASHGHAAGTLSNNGHTHNGGPLTVGAPSSGVEVQSGSGTTVATSHHVHGLGGNVQTLGGGDPPHSGSTALSSPSILPPYHGLYYIMKVA